MQKFVIWTENGGGLWLVVQPSGLVHYWTDKKRAATTFANQTDAEQYVLNHGLWEYGAEVEPEEVPDMTARQLHLPMQLPHLSRQKLSERISFREYQEIRERLVTLTREIGLELLDSGNVARACLRLGLDVAEAAMSRGDLTIQPERFTKDALERLRRMREWIQEAA